MTSGAPRDEEFEALVARVGLERNVAQLSGPEAARAEAGLASILGSDPRPKTEKGQRRGSLMAVGLVVTTVAAALAVVRFTPGDQARPSMAAQSPRPLVLTTSTKTMKDLDGAPSRQSASMVTRAEHVQFVRWDGRTVRTTDVYALPNGSTRTVVSDSWSLDTASNLYRSASADIVSDTVTATLANDLLLRPDTTVDAVRHGLAVEGGCATTIKTARCLMEGVARISVAAGVGPVRAFNVWSLFDQGSVVVAGESVDRLGRSVVAVTPAEEVGAADRLLMLVGSSSGELLGYETVIDGAVADFASITAAD